jgi:hypothetical protein
MAADRGVRAAFEFLVALAASSLNEERAKHLRGLGVDLREETTPLTLSRALQRWVEQNRDSLEYAALAQAAAGDAIVGWCQKRAQKQQRLFDPLPEGQEVWRAAANGAGFCQLARSFFAHFTRRYLNYFLEREASAVCPTIDSRDRFQQAIKNHVEEVSQHAFETARITQSFAAGWFNKYMVPAAPLPEPVGWFLRLAFNKMREELLREAR